MSTVIVMPTRLGRRTREEDLAQDAGLLAPEDRVTCAAHGRWIHQSLAVTRRVPELVAA